MSDIARAARLQQPSVYYWFARKELILQEIFAVDRTPLEFIERIGVGSGSPALKLFRLVRFDTIQLCHAPCHVDEIARLADQQPVIFAQFWEFRERLHDWFRQLIRAGIDEGMFRDVDPDLAAWNAMAADAGVQGWYRYQHRQPNAGAKGIAPVRWSSEQIAISVAEVTLRALLRDGKMLDAIRTEAVALDGAEPGSPC